MKPDDRNIPSLDGLRACSISLVLFGHLIGTRYFPIHRVNLPLGELTHFGVQLFFVISGFLITTLLLREQESTGRISVKAFYLRRFFRIFPPFYAYLIALVVASWLGWNTVTRTDLLRAATYTVNFPFKASWNVAHIWSLSTEEQFYLLWPAALILLGIRGARVIAGLAAVFPLIRLAATHLVPGFSFFFPNGMEAISAGCLLALFREQLWGNRLYRFLFTSRLVYLALFVPLVHIVFADHPRVFFLTGILLGPAVSVLMDSVVRNTSNNVGLFLNLTPIKFVGVLSYSIYVWHMPFINKASEHWIASFPVNIFGAVLCALGSFYFIERPLLHYRKQILSTHDLMSQEAAARMVRVDRGLRWRLRYLVPVQARTAQVMLHKPLQSSNIQQPKT